MISFNAAQEVCDIINHASNALYQVLGQKVVLKITAPIIDMSNLPELSAIEKKIEAVKRIVCEEMDITHTDLISRVKNRRNADARKLATLILYRTLNIGIPQIANQLGYSTGNFYSNFNSAKGLLIADKKIAARYEAINNRIITEVKYADN